MKTKRLTDTDKWMDPWFMDLPSKYKLLWLYILDNCDHAGIYKVNLRAAQALVGEHFEFSEVKRVFSGRIEEIKNGEYWFIRKFIKFQYGFLKPNAPVHNSVILALKSANISFEEFICRTDEPTVGLGWPYPTGKGKGKGKGQKVGESEGKKTIWQIKQQIEALEEKIRDHANRYRSETASGPVWESSEKKKQYSALRKRLKALKDELLQL